MATAQQAFVDQFVQLINSNPNLSPRVIASSPNTGILRVTQRTTDVPKADYLAGGSSVTGAGTFVSKAATGNPKYAELWFSWTLAPGDTVKINAGDAVQSVDLTYNLPLGTTVDAGGFDHTGYNPGGSTGGVAVGGTGIGSATHRRLVVMECGSASTSFGSLFALDPQDATGIAIPTFRVVTSLPAAGSSVGESVYVTATRQGYVYDGTAWRDITASPIRSFVNDTQLQANTTEAVGTYAVASDTGNMYVMTADGWRRIGIAEFSTYNDLNAWDAALGTEAISRDLDVVFLRVDNAAGTESWIPISQMVKPEADITAVQNIAGLTAIASDTGKRYVNNGTRWIQDPIEHYTTEALLLAATPIDGHLAWADDTNTVFTAAAGAWHRLAGPQITVGSTQPSTPGTGDMWYVRSGDEKGLKIFDGTDANPANHGWRDADRNPTLYVGVGAFNNATVNKTGNWGMPTSTVPDPQGYMPQADDQYLDVNTGLYSRLVGPVGGGITGSAAIGDVTSPTLQIELQSSGSTAQLIQNLSPRPTKLLRQKGVFAPKVGICYPQIIGQHDGAWIDWGGALVFEGAFLMQFESGGGHQSNLKSQSGIAGGYLITSSDDWAVGHHSPCPFEFNVMGFGLAGTNDFCHITYKLGPYKNRNGNHLTIDGIWRMGATFDPMKVHALGLKFTNNNNTGPCSFTTEWL